MLFNTPVIYVFLSSLLFGYACTNIIGSKKTSEKKSQSAHSSDYMSGKTTQAFSVKNERTADSSAFNIDKFLRENNYVIQYESAGFLNHDRYKDRVLVLKNNSEESNYLSRLTLVLLGSQQGFVLYKQSESIMQPEYTADDFKMFDTEDVNIEKNKIVFDLYAIGPNGHITYEFAWKDNDLQLQELLAYFMGAGSHTEYEYLPESTMEGSLKETVINTMEESMPSSTNSYHIKMKSAISFDNFSYNKCLEELIQQTGETK